MGTTKYLLKFVWGKTIDALGDVLPRLELPKFTKVCVCIVFFPAPRERKLATGGLYKPYVGTDLIAGNRRLHGWYICSVLLC